MKKNLIVVIAVFLFTQINAQEKSIGQLSDIQNNKTTSLQKEAWYSYTDALFSPYKSTVQYCNIYDDSTVQFDSPSGVYNNNVFGLGVSFDPTSSAFSSKAVNTDYAVQMQIQNGDSYTMDSILIVGMYHRNVNSIDTLFVDIAIVKDKTLNCYFNNTKSAEAYSLINSPDSVYHFATAKYDGNSNSIANEVAKVTIVKTLDNAAYLDTIHHGIHAWKLALPQKIQAEPGSKIVAYLHFKSGTITAIGTNYSQANFWSHPITSINGMNYPSVLPKDYNSGLVVGTDERYKSPSAATIYDPAIQQDQFIIPGSYLYHYNNPSNYHIYDPYFAFHLEWNTSLRIADIAKKAINVYPNPAKNMITIENLAKQSRLSIVDIKGNVLYNNINCNSTEQLNLENLPNGFFELLIEDVLGNKEVKRIVRSL